jgi:beta-lactam-binding protein with PASTA domain
VNPPPSPPHWAPGWLTLGITGAAGFLLGVVVLVAARGIVHDKTHTTTVTHTRTQVVEVEPKVPDVVGKSLGDARDELESHGYRVLSTGGGFFGADDSDTVQSQDPQAGVTVGGGATITLDVG